MKKLSLIILATACFNATSGLADTCPEPRKHYIFYEADNILRLPYTTTCSYGKDWEDQEGWFAFKEMYSVTIDGTEVKRGEGKWRKEPLRGTMGRYVYMCGLSLEENNELHPPFYLIEDCPFSLRPR